MIVSERHEMPERSDFQSGAKRVVAEAHSPVACMPQMRYKEYPCSRSSRDLSLQTLSSSRKIIFEDLGCHHITSALPHSSMVLAVVREPGCRPGSHPGGRECRSGAFQSYDACWT